MKKNEKEKREEAEQLHTACSKVHEEDEKRRDERREDATAVRFAAERTIERCRGCRQEARLNHQKAILLTVTSIQRTERPGDARPPENRGHVTDPPHSDP